jgi:hypothetical protein
MSWLVGEFFLIGQFFPIGDNQVRELDPCGDEVWGWQIFGNDRV